LSDFTLNTLIEGYNETPPNFQPPSDETINKCIKAVEHQIEIDEETQLKEVSTAKQVAMGEQVAQ